MGVFAIRVFAAGALLDQPPSAHTLQDAVLPAGAVRGGPPPGRGTAAALGAVMSLKELALRYALSGDRAASGAGRPVDAGASGRGGRVRRRGPLPVATLERLAVLLRPQPRNPFMNPRPDPVAMLVPKRESPISPPSSCRCDFRGEGSIGPRSCPATMLVRPSRPGPAAAAGGPARRLGVVQMEGTDRLRHVPETDRRRLGEFLPPERLPNVGAAGRRRCGLHRAGQNGPPTSTRPPTCWPVAR